MTFDPYAYALDMQQKMDEVMDPLGGGYITIHDGVHNEFMGTIKEYSPTTGLLVAEHKVPASLWIPSDSMYLTELNVAVQWVGGWDKEDKEEQQYVLTSAVYITGGKIYFSFPAPTAEDPQARRHEPFPIRKGMENYALSIHFQTITANPVVAKELEQKLVKEYGFKRPAAKLKTEMGVNDARQTEFISVAIPVPDEENMLDQPGAIAYRRIELGAAHGPRVSSLDVGESRERNLPNGKPGPIIFGDFLGAWTDSMMRSLDRATTDDELRNKKQNSLAGCITGTKEDTPRQNQAGQPYVPVYPNRCNTRTITLAGSSPLILTGAKFKPATEAK